MKPITTAILILLASTCLGQDYVIKSNGDTLFGDITMGAYKKGKSSSVKLKTAKKRTYNFNTASSKKLRHDGFDYQVHLLTPEKPKKKDRDFMKVLLSDGTNSICYHRIVSASGGGMYGAAVTNNFKYYLFKGDKFVEYLKNGNAKKLIQQYFGSCSKTMEVIASMKKVKVHKMEQLFNGKCE